MSAENRCMTCGKPTPIHLLDAKPERYRGVPLPKDYMEYENEGFDWLECRSCYGPGWVEGVKG